MSEWLERLCTFGALSDSESIALQTYDSEKIKRLQALNRAIGLPIIPSWTVNGVNFAQSNGQLQSFLKKHQGSRLSVGARPMASGVGSRARAHGLTADELFRFVDDLKPSRHAFTITLAPYFDPELSGHLIVSAEGVTIEAVRGRLMVLSQGWAGSDELVHAYYKFPQGGLQYSTASIDVRSIMWRALQCLFLDRTSAISPHSLPRIVFGYFEFVFHPAHGLFFVDANQSPLFFSQTFTKSVPVLHTDTSVLAPVKS